MDPRELARAGGVRLCRRSPSGTEVVAAVNVSFQEEVGEERMARCPQGVTRTDSDTLVLPHSSASVGAMTDNRIAIVHERFTEVAGSEYVVEQLAAQWPDAAVHVPLARPGGVPQGLFGPPRTTWVDSLYRALGQIGRTPTDPAYTNSVSRYEVGGCRRCGGQPSRVRDSSGVRHGCPGDGVCTQPCAVGMGILDACTRGGRPGGRCGAGPLSRLPARENWPRLRGCVASSPIRLP